MSGAWWRHAVTYQVYLRSFQDSDGDGVGDLEGLRRRLDHIVDLGADAIWMTPHYPSPMADHGYDVSDHRGVDPLFGDLAAFDRLLGDVHARGLRLLLDIVPNHTSDQHPWFRSAISSPDDPHRERYIFAPPRPGGGLPNNWPSVFGGSAWSPDPFGDYYLHLFAPEQPDLNWRHAEVRREFESILQFWLDRGVDGFRIDVAHGLFKDSALRDNPDGQAHLMQWNQPGNHDVFRSWRRICDTADPPAVLVGEVLLKRPDPEVIASYVGEKTLHQAFSFAITSAPFDADAFRAVSTRVLETLEGTGSAPAWVLSNHDVVRHATRYGGGDSGRRRAAAALLFVLALPGSVFLYQGEELGAEQVEIPPARRQDPVYLRTGGALPGRDGARTPMPWTYEPPGHGFSSGEPWLPLAADATTRNATTQAADPASMLALYRTAISLRRTPLFRDGALHWLETPPGTAAFKRELREGAVACYLNSGNGTVSLATGGGLLLASAPGARLERGRLELPGDSAAWIQPA